jgi:fucose permease
VREPALLAMVSVATAILAAGLVTGAGWRSGSVPWILLLGIAFGPVWPLAFAVATHEFAVEAGAVSGLLAAAGAVGGIAGPWLQGLLLVQRGVYAGMGFTFAASLLMACCALAALREVATQSARTEAATPVARGEC